VTPLVFFVIKMKLLLISSFSVAWQEQYGLLLHIVLGPQMFPVVSISAGTGVRNGCHLDRTFMLLGLWLFVGPFGKRVIVCAFSVK
jgi:hypothetical protein